MSESVKQVGGSHYRGGKLQHWDIVGYFDVDYFVASATAYLLRWREKGGLIDLRKAVSYLEKRGTLGLPGQILDSSVRGFVPSGMIDHLAQLHELTSQEHVILGMCFRTPGIASTHLNFYLNSLPRPGTPEDGGHYKDNGE